MRRLAIYTLLLFLCPGMPAHAIDKIVILGLFKEKAIMEIDGKRRTISSGETTPEGITLISANSDEARLEINGEINTYTLGTHIGSSYKAPTGMKTVTIAPDLHGMYHVNGQVNDFYMYFVVDTGATLITMNKFQAKRLGINYKLDGEESLTSTASGIEKIYMVVLDSVAVGDIKLTDVQAAVIDGNYPEVTLLGNSFLNRIDISREGKLLELQKK